MILLSLTSALVHTAVVTSGMQFFRTNRVRPASEAECSIVATVMTISLVFIVSQCVAWILHPNAAPQGLQAMLYGFVLTSGVAHLTLIRQYLHRPQGEEHV